jgi:hypothetical protein
MVVYHLWIEYAFPDTLRTRLTVKMSAGLDLRKP